MKNLLDFVKIFLLAAVIILPATCQAAINYMSVSVTQLKDIVGNWYDAKGNLVLTISNDYKLNGCQIMSVGFMGDTAAMYKIVFRDGNQNKYIEVTHTGSSAVEHQILVINSTNNSYALRRTKNPQYFESVGGIYLGMGQDDVLKLYGAPSEKNNSGRDYTTWKYNNIGLELSFYAGIVNSIKFSAYGDRKLDWSGLSANSSKSAFESKYGTSFSRRGNLNIGRGEIINFRDGNITLGILTPGYAF